MAPSILDDLPGWAREMLEGARVGHLGMIDDRDCPRVLPITFALHEGVLYSAVDRKPKADPRKLARIRYLRRHPLASLTVDRYAEDWSRLAWVQAIGRVEIVEIDRHPVALEALSAKYPQYRDQSPLPGPLIVLRTERTACWRAG
jgi:PPOX class probable F420-dependent enzyme